MVDINELEYFNEKDMKERLSSLEGITIEEESDNHFLVYDDYNEDFDRFITFHKKDKIVVENMIHFGNTEINKESMIEALKSTNPILLMNINKIIFVNNMDEFNNLHLLSENHSLPKDALGMFVWYDGNIIINVMAIKKCIDEEEKEDLEEFGYYNYSNQFNKAICETLFHELFHSLQSNPLYETLFKFNDEDTAEQFAREEYDRRRCMVVA